MVIKNKKDYTLYAVLRDGHKIHVMYVIFIWHVIIFLNVYNQNIIIIYQNHCLIMYNNVLSMFNNV